MEWLIGTVHVCELQVFFGAKTKQLPKATVALFVMYDSLSNWISLQLSVVVPPETVSVAPSTNFNFIFEVNVLLADAVKSPLIRNVTSSDEYAAIALSRAAFVVPYVNATSTS